MTTSTRTWGNYILEMRVEFGSAARRNRGAYSGAKVHRLISEYIVGVVDEAKENALLYSTLGKRFLVNRTPTLFSCSPACGCTQGQNSGRPNSSRTEADVTCEKCKS